MTLNVSINDTSAVSQPFWLMVAANLTLPVDLSWKWSLWPVPTWLAKQRSKAVFFLILYVNIKDTKHFWTVSIKTQLCHSNFCCWLLPIWPKLDVWAEYGAYGQCRLGWRYNGRKISFPDLIWYYLWYETLQNYLHYTSDVPQPFLLLIAANLAQAGCLGWKWSLRPVPAWLTVQRSKAVFFWPYMILSMIWNTSQLSPAELSRATAIFVVGGCQIDPSGMLGLKMELMACADLVGGTTEQRCIFTELTCY